MTLEEIYYISQIASSLAVLASLIYLALQTRQTSRNQQAQMHAMRLQLVRDDTRRMGSPEFAPIFRAGMTADPGMDAERFNQFITFSYGLLLNLQEQYHDYMEGMINARRWEPRQRALEQFLTAPGFRAAFQQNRTTLDVEFTAFVDKLIARARVSVAPQSALERWLQLAAAERSAVHSGASASTT